jgi:rSAM/selenodomain-associated transferase 1
LSTLAVIAKAPVPGRVKTRLCPPCTPAQAAALAEACLRDTLAAMAALTGPRRVVILDGEPGPWLTDELVVAQRGGGLDERLAAAFDDLPGPTLILGMDTPQVTPAQLRAALDALRRHDAVLGPTADGGYWCIGLARACPDALLGVPMSRPDTLHAQRARLAEQGIAWAEVDELIDIDTIDDAVAVAGGAPTGRFARTLAGLELGPVTASAR